MGTRSANAGLVTSAPRFRHLGEDPPEQPGDNLQLMPRNPIVGRVSGAAVFGHLEERLWPFRPAPAPVEEGPAPRGTYPFIELWDAAATRYFSTEKTERCSSPERLSGGAA